MKNPTLVAPASSRLVLSALLAFSLVGIRPLQASPRPSDVSDANAAAMMAPSAVCLWPVANLRIDFSSFFGVLGYIGLGFRDDSAA